MLCFVLLAPEVWGSIPASPASTFVPFWLSYEETKGPNLTGEITCLPIPFIASLELHWIVSLWTLGVFPQQKQQQCDTFLCTLYPVAPPDCCVTASPHRGDGGKALNKHKLATFPPLLRKNYIWNWLSRILGPVYSAIIRDQYLFKGEMAVNGQSNISASNKSLGIPVCPEFQNWTTGTPSTVPQGHIQSGWSSISDWRSGRHQIRYGL